MATRVNKRPPLKKDVAAGGEKKLCFIIIDIYT